MPRIRALRASFVVALLLVVLLPAAGTPSAAAAPTADPIAGVDYVDGRVLVKFRPGASAAAQALAHRAAGGRVEGTVGRLGVQVIDAGPGRALAAIEAYARNPNVLYAEVDGIVHAAVGCTGDTGTFSNDPCSWRQWGLHNDGTSYGAGTGTADADVDIPEAWATGITGAGITVAVLDTGYDRSHEELASKVDASADFTGAGIDDLHGHGTWTASIAAGNTGNGTGIAGAAPDADVIVGKVLNNAGSGSWSMVAAGIDWAVANAGTNPLVISMSLGGSCRGGPFGCITLQTAVDNAATAGALLVAAAGNSGGSTEYPGAYSNVLAVAATNPNDTIAAFSSVGNVAAPGVDIIGAFPDCTGAESTFTLRTNNGLDCHYDYGSGTSAATPIVAGVAAILWSSNPDMSAAAVRNAITSTATNIPGTNYDGAGRISACAALDSLGVLCSEGGGGDPDPTTPPDPTPPPDPGSGTLVGSSENNGRTWTAIVTNTGSATVTGVWTGGSPCTLPAGASCRLEGLAKKTSSVTFTVNETGESVTVSKP